MSKLMLTSQLNIYFIIFTSILISESISCSYSVFGYGNCLGNTIKTFYAKKHSYCRAQCDALTDCKGYWYKVTNSVQRCSLKTIICNNPTGNGKMWQKGRLKFEENE